MILARDKLPKWTRPVADGAGRFSVFYLDHVHVFQYVFTTERERVTLVAVGWWDATGGSGWNSDVRSNPFMPAAVMVAAGLEAQRRAGKRPKKSLWWWVVKAGVYYIDDSRDGHARFQREQNQATRYTDRRRAVRQCRFVDDWRVVRVRARGAR